jgi:hypothetical protein
VLGHERFSAAALLEAIPACGVTSLCAPPTVWRMLVQADPASADVRSLRECVGAGKPLNPEVVELRAQEDDRHGAGGDAGAQAPRGAAEFWEDDFPGLKG